MSARKLFVLLAAVAGLSTALIACEAGVSKSIATELPAHGSGAEDPFLVYNDGENIDFTPIPLQTSAAKIKAMLWGDVLTQSDIASLGDPDDFRATVHRWVTSQDSNRALLDFFTTAFQQRAIIDYSQLFPHGAEDGVLGGQIVQSFPLTALDAVRKNLPFTSLYTTHSFMVTTRLLMTMLHADLIDFDDNGGKIDLAERDGNFSWTYVSTGEPIAIEASVDPKNANFLKFYAPVVQQGEPRCQFEGPRTITAANHYRSVSSDLWQFLNGRDFGYDNKGLCIVNASNRKVVDTDNSDWHLVTFDTVPDYASITPFYDFPKLRGVSRVNARTRRTGFFTTPAFFGQWVSNPGNDARGITNQALIVGLGRTFDGSDKTMPASLTALNEVHAEFGSACYGCHVTMDPMRQFFRQAYTHTFHLQNNQNQITTPGVWALDGATSIGLGGIDEFASLLASHPDVAMVWTQRLCSWINNVPCLKEDPELIRLAASFKANNFNFLTLLEDVLVSPITTNTKATLTAVRLGVVPTMAKAQDFCQVLARRLGTPQVCGGAGNLGRVNAPLGALPSPSYNRGLVQTVGITSPSMMTRTATENVCGLVATEVVDGTLKLLPSSDPDGSINKIVAQLMGIDDAKAAPYVSILKAHYADCMAQKASAADALRSAIIVACMSPKVAMIGL